MRRANLAAKCVLPLLCLILIGCTEDVPDPLTEANVREMLKEKSGIAIENGNGSKNGNGDDIVIIIEPLPDSSMIAFVSMDEKDLRIYLIKPDGTERRALTEDWVAMTSYGPFWSPDGKVAFWSSVDSAIQVMNTDGTRHSQVFINNVGPLFEPDYHFSWSNGGKIAFSHDSADFSSSDVYAVNADGTNLTQVTFSVWSFSSYPSWSPDGAQLAFAFEDIDGDLNIYIGGIALNPLQITFTGEEEEPAWSPDGTKIAFTSDRDSDYEIYSMNPDGTGQINLTNRPATDDYTPTWSPDGTQIAFVSEDDDFNTDIYVMNSDGTNQKNITNTPGVDEFTPSWSP